MSDGLSIELIVIVSIAILCLILAVGYVVTSSAQKVISNVTHICNDYCLNEYNIGTSRLEIVPGEGKACYCVQGNVAYKVGYIREQVQDSEDHRIVIGLQQNHVYELIVDKCESEGK